mgnify:CR=1 FL=1
MTQVTMMGNPIEVSGNFPQKRGKSDLTYAHQ